MRYEAQYGQWLGRQTRLRPRKVYSDEEIIARIERREARLAGIEDALTPVFIFIHLVAIGFLAWVFYRFCVFIGAL